MPTVEYGNARIVATDALATTGQVKIATADITGNGCIVGFGYHGATAGDSCIVRSTNGSGAVLLDIKPNVTGELHSLGLPAESWRRFTTGIHATFAGTGAHRLVLYVILDHANA